MSQSNSGGDGWDGFLSGLKVMVVDDDPLCLKVVEHMLKRCSYTGMLLATERSATCLQYCGIAECTKMPAVTTCPNGVTALEKLRDKSQRFDLVLSDVYMPGKRTRHLVHLHWLRCQCSCNVTSETLVFLQMLMGSSCLSTLVWS